MGVYSTMQITREDALKALLPRLLSATDEVLEGMLFDVFGPGSLHNFSIVAAYPDPGDPDSWDINYRDRPRALED